MGFLDKLRGKKNKEAPKETSETAPKPDQESPSGRRVKRYTSEGKPVYE
jgi:hypothetical protein